MVVGWCVEVLLKGAAGNPYLTPDVDAAELMATHQLVDGVAPDVQQLRNLRDGKCEGEVRHETHPLADAH